MKKPIIGITLDLANDSEKYSYARHPWYALRQNYAQCIIEAGGIPIMLPYSDNIDALLNMIDGLLIPGGDEDINPKFYGQTIKSDKVKTNDERAEFELKFTQKAIDQNMPIFGICGGMQVINVVLGGSLIQHIPDYIKSDINHEQPYPKDAPTHLINIEENTLLMEMAGQKELMINSTHHQAIDVLGKDLIITAKANDGIIEAIESVRHRFLVGVQWHSEYLNTNLDRNLFKRLVEESAKFI